MSATKTKTTKKLTLTQAKSMNDTERARGKIAWLGAPVMD